MASVASFFAAQRASLLTLGTAVSKAHNGLVPTNPFEIAPAVPGLRASIVKDQEVRFEKRLQTDFRLVIKHPNCFTATLSTLVSRYSCYAIIRNPLAALLSWHSIQAPVNDGHVPFGEAFDAALKLELAAEPDRLSRQLIILRWCYSRYANLLSRDHVIRYEELVASGGRALAVIDPAAEDLKEVLESRNTNKLYDPNIVHHLADRLLDTPSIYDAFYERNEIEDLYKKWLSS